MRTFTSFLFVALVVSAGATIFVLAGLFNVAADVPHSGLVLRIMELARDRSIAVRARYIKSPSLNDPKLVAAGAEQYAAMCIDCHLAPGIEESELRKGLYPQPPDLAKHAPSSPAKTFWIIKHGIKMTAMPAWGLTHDDDSIWGLVAFLQRLPELTPDQYKVLVQRREPTLPHHDGDHHPPGQHRHK